MENMLKKFNFVKKFITKLSSKSQWTNESDMYHLEPNSIKWYTDGSKTTEGTGAGVYGRRTKYFEPMGKNASIFQAEVFAIELCARFNIEKNYRGAHIAIMSDSQAAIKALSSCTISSKLVWNCIEKLNELGEGNHVSLCWVPGHVGIPGNEEADVLAKTGADTPFTGPEPFSGIGSNCIQRLLKEQEEEKWAKYWSNLPGLRQSKIMLGKFNRSRSNILVQLDRNKLRILTGFLTGHCKLKKHLKNMGLENDSTCRFCGEEEEEPIHILTNCGALIHKRHRRFGYYYLEGGEVPQLKPIHILKFLTEIGLEGEL